MPLVVSEQLGNIRQRRIENNIKKWRQDLRKMTEDDEKERESMDRSYGLSGKGTIHHIFSETNNYYCWSKDPPIQPKEPTVPPEHRIQL